MFDDPEESIGLLNIAAESAIKGVEVLANASSSKILGGDSVLRSKTDDIVDGDGDRIAFIVALLDESWLQEVVFVVKRFCCPLRC